MNSTFFWLTRNGRRGIVCQRRHPQKRADVHGTASERSDDIAFHIGRSFTKDTSASIRVSTSNSRFVQLKKEVLTLLLSSCPLR